MLGCLHIKKHIVMSIIDGSRINILKVFPR